MKFLKKVYAEIALLSLVKFLIPSNSLATEIDLANKTSCQVIVGSAPDGLISANSSVAVAGDLNGDNLDDLVMHEYASGSNGGTRSIIKIVYGTSPMKPLLDLQTDANAVILAEQGDDSLGASARLADINCDGYKDLILGASTIKSTAGYNIGSVYIFFGGPAFPASIDLMTTAPSVKITGYDPGGGQGGKYLVGAWMGTGDVDGDGCKDLVLGIDSDGPNGTRLFAGEVQILYGKPNVPPLIDLGQTALDTLIYAAKANDGGTMLTTGHYDPDTIDDIVIGTKYNILQVFKGGIFAPVIDLATQPSDRQIFVIDPQSLSQSPYTDYPLSTGDFDGDGQQELSFTFVAESIGGSTKNGLTGIMKTSMLPAPPRDTSVEPPEGMVYGSDSDDMLGQRILWADLNGDGADDLITNSRGDGPGNIRPKCGEACVLYGGGSLNSRWLQRDPAHVTVYGPQATDPTFFWWPSVAAGDLDGDGEQELVVSYPTAGHPSMPTRIEPGVTYVLCRSDLSEYVLRNSIVTNTAPITPPLSTIFPLGANDRYALVAAGALVIGGDLDGTNPKDPGQHPLIFYQTESNARLRMVKANTSDVKIFW